LGHEPRMAVTGMEIIPGTGRTNMCRERVSTMTNAQTVPSLPVSGSSHRPSCP
jgi:hypothetical protein